jgi:ribosome-associated translation inhibitor RaiA/cold shock CspA family protein
MNGALQRAWTMQRPLQITYKGMESSPTFDAIIGERVAHLERLYPRLIGCRVVVEVPHRGAETAKVPLAVSVEADIPGRGPIIGKDEEGRHDAKGDHAAPLNKAFDAVERQLEKIGDLQNYQEAKQHEDAGQTGMVVRLFREQNYGFIEFDKSPELYFTRNAVVGDFDELEVGMMVHVTRSTEEGPMGPQASSVRLLDRSKTPS